MMLTLWLMALGSLLFAIAPTYAQIGIAAPVIIVLVRLIQGFAIGGEVGASTAMLMEHADDNNRGFYGSWQLFSQGLSFLLGALVALGAIPMLLLIYPAFMLMNHVPALGFGSYVGGVGEGQGNGWQSVGLIWGWQAGSAAALT